MIIVPRKQECSFVHILMYIKEIENYTVLVSELENGDSIYFLGLVRKTNFFHKMYRKLMYKIKPHLNG